jgi:hypothetical protein
MSSKSPRISDHRSGSDGPSAALANLAWMDIIVAVRAEIAETYG